MRREKLLENKQVTDLRANPILLFSVSEVMLGHRLTSPKQTVYDCLCTTQAELSVWKETVCLPNQERICSLAFYKTVCSPCSLSRSPGMAPSTFLPCCPSHQCSAQCVLASFHLEAFCFLVHSAKAFHKPHQLGVPSLGPPQTSVSTNFFLLSHHPLRVVNSLQADFCLDLDFTVNSIWHIL